MDGSFSSAVLMDMDVDGIDLPDDLIQIDETFLEEYLKGVEADVDPRTLPSSFNLDDVGHMPAPALMQVNSASASGGSNRSAGGGNSGENMQAAQASYSSGSAHTQPSREPRVPVSVFQEAEDDEEDFAQPNSRRNGAGAGGTRKVTPQRKQNNRKAQQRYREKRKAQAQEMEQQVASLAFRLQAMEGLKQEAEQISSENLQLKAALADQAAELAALRKAMAGKESPSGKCEDVLDQPAARDNLCRPELKMSLEETLSHLKQITDTLQSLLSQAQLPTDRILSGDPRYHDSHLLAQLQEHIGPAERLSVAKLLLAPPCPIRKETVTGKVGRCQMYRKHITSILVSLQLSSAQCDALLSARQKMLDKLRTLYEERTQLNNITMSIMLPRVPRDHSDDKPYLGTPEGKIRCAERYGSSSVILGHSAELSDALDRLKVNLCQERKLLVRLHELMLKTVLTPAQAAVALIKAGDHTFEPLGLCNLIALQRGLIDDPCSMGESPTTVHSYHQSRDIVETAAQSSGPAVVLQG